MKSNIKFGPAGLGSVKTTIETLEEYHRLGFKACEIAFTYSVYIKDKKDAEAIGKKARELGISLSIHAPYFLNLNSAEKPKIEASKVRILNCCKVGSWLGAKTVVFHPGYYGSDREKAYEMIKNGILEIMKELKKREWKIKIAPESMGKINVFGSVEEISRLVKDTGCSFCIDFAHILARDKKVDYEKIKKLFPQKEWHVHFSGIVYGEKGERHHRTTKKEEWKELLKNLPRNKDIVIINESPTMIDDCLMALDILGK
ncbi:MAG: TIM barrel protein [Nanoarchaeota archaeon]|nr:TIM barrel protein [Nanoarchaeota archaeon]